MPLRRSIIRIASELPKGDPTRRKLLALLRVSWGEAKRLGPRLVGILDAGQGLVIRANGRVVPVSPKNGEQFSASEVQGYVGGRVQWSYYGNYRFIENARSPSASSNIRGEDAPLDLPVNEKATILRGKNPRTDIPVYGDVFIAAPSLLAFLR